MHTSEWRAFRLSWPETADVVHASVLAGATETRYMRTGAGRPVLLLLDDPEAGGVGSRPRFRVPVPEAVVATAGGGPAFSAWMRAFLDGLGAPRVSVVARGACAVAALCFALREPERVDRLVLVSRSWSSTRTSLARTSPGRTGRRTGRPREWRTSSRASSSSGGSGSPRAEGRERTAERSEGSTPCPRCGPLAATRVTGGRRRARRVT
jgi:pimeloyl-ACP methyl ester carboxylesterase